MVSNMNYVTVLIPQGGPAECYWSYELDTARTLALAPRKGTIALIFERGNPLPIETHE